MAVLTYLVPIHQGFLCRHAVVQVEEAVAAEFAKIGSIDDFRHHRLFVLASVAAAEIDLAAYAVIDAAGAD